jgi:SAM-dependent methyltransferase
MASGWQSGAAARGEAMAAATELLLDLAGVAAGSRVLDVGAGSGDQTLVAAQRVGPNGSVLATDPAASMLDLAAEAVRAADFRNVQTQVMDAQQLDLEPDSFDAVIARNSLQFVPDLPRALAEIRRVLKPGGKLAGMTWSVTDNNPYRAIPQAIASRLAGRPFPEPGPGQWGLRDAGALAEAFRAAGFGEVDVRPVPITWRFPSLDAAIQNAEASQPHLIRLLGMLGEADRAAARAEIRHALQAFVGQAGFEAPGEALIASGTA